MTSVPFTALNAGVRVNADVTTDNTTAIPGLPRANGVVRVVNLSGVNVHVALGVAGISATNTDTVLTSNGGNETTIYLNIGPSVTHIALRAASGSNNVVLAQAGVMGL